MLKGLGDIGNLMKMQKEMKEMQKKLKKASLEGMSSDDSVKATVNGEYELLDIKVSQDLIRTGDIKKIEKMILSAVNDAIVKVKEYSASEMARLAGGMDLSNFFK